MLQSAEQYIQIRTYVTLLTTNFKVASQNCLRMMRRNVLGTSMIITIRITHIQTVLQGDWNTFFPLPPSAQTTLINEGIEKKSVFFAYISHSKY